MERYETYLFYQRLFIDRHNLQNWKKQKVLLTFDEYHNNTATFITTDLYRKWFVLRNSDSYFSYVEQDGEYN